MNKVQLVIEGCLNYIETHLREKIALEDLAGHAGISKYHLHRIFKSLTGESIISYATSRKLAESIGELVHSRMKILDIALEYGFEHEQSYIRAFKKEYGRTPLKVRTGDETIPIKERIRLNDLTVIENAITYRPFFVVKPAFYLVGIEYPIYVDSDYRIPNNVGRDFFYHQKMQISDLVQPDIYFGFVDWSHIKSGYTVYSPSVQVSRVAAIPPGMTSRLIPPHKYVVFRFVGFFHPEQVNIRHFYHLLEYMYSKWVLEAGYDFAAEFRFEYIDNSIGRDDYCEVDIYQAVKKKEHKQNQPVEYSVFQRS